MTTKTIKLSIVECLLMLLGIESTITNARRASNTLGFAIGAPVPVFAYLCAHYWLIASYGASDWLAFSIFVCVQIATLVYSSMSVYSYMIDVLKGSKAKTISFIIIMEVTLAATVLIDHVSASIAGYMVVALLVGLNGIALAHSSFMNCKTIVTARGKTRKR